MRGPPLLRTLEVASLADFVLLLSGLAAWALRFTGVLTGSTTAGGWTATLSWASRAAVLVLLLGPIVFTFRPDVETTHKLGSQIQRALREATTNLYCRRGRIQRSRLKT